MSARCFRPKSSLFNLSNALLVALSVGIVAPVGLSADPSAEHISAPSSDGASSAFSGTPAAEDGYAHLEAGNKHLALAAFNQALEVNAQDLPARLGQAMIYADQQRHADAFSSYDLIVQEYPQHAFAWNGRGLAAFNMENFDEALTSFEKATADQPINGFFYESLAWTHMCMGEFSEAVATAKQASLMYNQNGEHSSYPLLIAYFSSLELGDRAEASRTLNYALRNLKPNGSWPTPIFGYLSGQIDAPELISWVSNTAEETEAHTYIGLKLRSEGLAEAGQVHLDWVAAKGDERVFEYTLARAINMPESVALLTN